MKALSSIAVILALCGPAASAPALEPAGFVAAVRAPAHLERAGQPIEARVGLQIQQGDVLATGPKGRLKVLLSDDSVVSLGTSSRVELTRYRFAPAAHERSTRLMLTGGLVRALVQKLVSDTPADFEARTRTAVAGVRGTEFALRAQDESGPARLVTFSGVVDWSSPGSEPVRVAAGQSSGLVDGRAGAVEAVAAAELDALRGATDTVQAPAALAWNIAPRDRIRSGRERPGARGRLDLDPASREGSKAGSGPVTLGFDAGRDESLEGGQDLWDGGPGGRPVGGGIGSGQGRYEGEGVLPPDGNDASELLTGDWSSSFAAEPGMSFIPARLDVTVVRH